MSTIIRQLKKPWVVMPLVALLAFGGWFLFKPDGSSSADQAATANDQVVQATQGPMAKTVSADGTLAAASTEDLNFDSAGTVTAVNVKAGQKVKKGQVLAEIDSAELQASVSAAQANLADAQAKLSDDQDASASDQQITVDESSVTSAQDQVDAANKALAGAKLVASADSTVASVNITVGESLTTGGGGGTDQTGSNSGSGNSSASLPTGGSNLPNSSSSNSGSTSDADISLVSSGRFTVDLGFDSTDIGNIKVGQVATITVSTSSSSGRGGFGAFPGFGGAFAGGGAATRSNTSGTGAATTTTQPQTTTEGVKGLVTEVGTVADASSGVASYPVTVAFSDTSGQYNVGATVTVSISYASVDNAISVPSFVVTTNTDGTQSVTVKTKSGTETRTVTTGLTSGNMVQITSGLRADESVVITFPGRRLTTGSGTGGGNAPTGFPAGGPSFTPGGGS